MRSEDVYRIIGGIFVLLSLLFGVFALFEFIARSPLWDKEGAGAAWIQALGSVLALAVAIYVMSRQNKHAAELVIEADRIAIRRRAAAVYALLIRAKGQVLSVLAIVQKPLPNDANARNDRARSLATAATVVQEMRTALLQVPTYELGSFDMALGMQAVIENLGVLGSLVQLMSDDVSQMHTPEALTPLALVVSHIDDALQRFQTGRAAI